MALSEHLEKLRYFHKLCGYPSLQAAARDLGVSQAGLSKSLLALETVLETKLFVRTSAGLVITQSGKALFESAERILSESLRAEATIKLRGRVAVPESVRFGMYDSIAVYFYSGLAKYIESVYPDVEVDLTIERSAKLCNELKAGDLDLLIGVNTESALDKSNDYFHLWNDHYGFYVNSQIHEVDETLPVIFYPDAQCARGKSCASYLEPITSKRAVVKAYNFETIKALTLNSVGCGVLPTQVARPLVHTGQLRSVRLLNQKQVFGPHSIGMLVRRPFLKKHSEFVQDILRLGSSWAKN